MTADYRDPFEVPAPAVNDFGRLYTHAVLEPGWQCRLCSNLLAATHPTGGLLCTRCDLNMESQ